MPRSAAPWSTYAGTSAGRTRITRTPERSTSNRLPSSAALRRTTPARERSRSAPGSSTPVGMAIEKLPSPLRGEVWRVARGCLPFAGVIPAIRQPGRDLLWRQRPGASPAGGPGDLRRAAALDEIFGANRTPPRPRVAVGSRLGVDHSPHSEQPQCRPQAHGNVEAGASPRDRGVDAGHRRQAGAAQQLPHQVELNHKPGGRGRAAKTSQEAVVPAALRDRPPEVLPIAFEDDARVVVEVADRAEVEADHRAQAVRDQQLAHPRQPRQGFLRAPVADQSAGGFENLRAATKRREPQQKLVLRGTKWSLRQQVLEGHEISRGEGAAYAGLYSRRQPDGVHDALEELRVPDVDLVAAQPGGLEAARGERDHLGVGDRTRRPHQLRTDLVGLASLMKPTL